MGPTLCNVYFDLVMSRLEANIEILCCVDDTALIFSAKKPEHLRRIAEKSLSKIL